jgi:hypothetical protein
MAEMPDYTTQSARCRIVADSGWHPGLIGLVVRQNLYNDCMLGAGWRAADVR